MALQDTLPVGATVTVHGHRNRDAQKFGTGKWCRVLIDATVNLDFEPEPNYNGDRYPPSVKPDPQDWELVDRRWREYGF